MCPCRTRSAASDIRRVEPDMSLKARPTTGGTNATELPPVWWLMAKVATQLRCSGRGGGPATLDDNAVFISAVLLMARAANGSIPCIPPTKAAEQIEWREWRVPPALRRLPVEASRVAQSSSPCWVTFLLGWMGACKAGGPPCGGYSIIARIGSGHFVRITMSGRMRWIAGRKLSWRKVGAGRGNTLLQFFNLESNGVLHLVSLPSGLRINHGPPIESLDFIHCWSF